MKILLLFRCQGCGKAFEAPQGSRRRYCPDCRWEREHQGRPPRKVKKEARG